jgi:hypothetical protein
MSSIPWLADLEYLSSFETVLLVLLVIIGCMAAGFAIDVIMRDLGLGPFPNGILALIGVCAGIYVRYRLFAHYHADDVFLTISFAIAIPIVPFLGFAFAKSRGL